MINVALETPGTAVKSLCAREEKLNWGAKDKMKKSTTVFQAGGNNTWPTPTGGHKN